MPKELEHSRQILGALALIRQLGRREIVVFEARQFRGFLARKQADPK